MLDTAYRQKKQAERPGNPLAAYVPIQKIENGIVYTTDHRFIKILEIVPINFLLRSAREQRNIVYSFISYLKIAPVKLQIKVITKRADMNRHIETVRRERRRRRTKAAGCSRRTIEAAQKAWIQRSHCAQVFPHHGV